MAAAFANTLNISAANLGIVLGAAALALPTGGLVALMGREGAEGLGETPAKPR